MRRILFTSAILIFGLSAVTYGQNKSPKRGICGDASPQDLVILAPSVTWYYDWGVEPPAVSQGQLSGIEWVPMCWGAVYPGDVAGIEARIPAGSKYLLGFNEPNFKSQANLTPSQAASMWPNLEKIAADKGLELVSPAVNWCGDCVDGVTNDPVDWLDKFFAACPGCKVDYIAIHSYAPGSAALSNYLDKFRKYNKPLWITEFAPWDPPKPDFEGVVKYMMEAIPILENDPSVFRYSWFATRVGINPDISLLGANGALTKLGQLYTSMAFQGMTSDLPPVAMAGPDIFINEPASTATLKGSVYDANGDIPSIVWSQVSGPGTAVFDNSAIATPAVSGLVPGVYTFRITATAGGKTDYDEVSVTVGPPNIALSKPATASSVESASTPASAVNDGNKNSRWSSAFSDPQWIRIDLQAVYNLTGARIFWEAAAAKSFEIQISNNANTWTRVFSTTGGDGGTDNFSFTGAARYIRMLSTSRTTQYGNSIYEFEVFGTLQTGIEDQPELKTFSAYPNPATGGIIHISFSSDLAGNDVVLSVNNISGQLICSDIIKITDEEAGDIPFPINDQMRSGIYILTARGKNIIKHTN
ncbi:MAG TPA: glycosyl hydrolase, partial [Bacteroidales bacterium]|nr:glycosyl hydrolase [Bacteroidales bacterium]